MVPPIHLGAWSMALMLWLPFELLLLLFSFMAMFDLSCAGTKVMLDAIGQVLEDPSFKIPTAEATEARDAALNLSAWQ